MDTFTLVIFLIMIMIAINQNVWWAAVGLMGILILSIRSVGLLILAVIAVSLAAMFQSQSQLIWILLAMVILGVFIFKTQVGGGPGMYSPQALLG